MTWSEISERLKAEWQNLDGIAVEGLVFLPCPFDDLNRRTIEAEKRLRDSVDLAALSFIKTGELPNDARVLFLLRDRFFAGFLLGAQLDIQVGFKAIVSDTVISDEERLHWLLIDTWENFGLPLFILCLEEKYSGAIGYAKLIAKGDAKVISGAINGSLNPVSTPLFFRGNAGISASSWTA